MAFQVKVRQFDAPIVVEMGQTILQAALAQGFAYPCGCKSGNCGACKSTLFTGDVEMSPYSEFALSQAEKETGLILACRAVPWSDCEVAYLESDEVVAHPLRKLDCRVSKLVQHTHDITGVHLRIEAGGPYEFSAGQFAALTFGSLEPRDYSMANRPNDAELVFHIRAMPGGDVSHYVATELAVGDPVRVEGPLGVSYLRDQHTGPILALAGGSGLAPITSIVDTALEMGMQQPIHLYVGMRDHRDVYLESHFQGLARTHPNLKVEIILSEASDPGGRRTGFLADALRRDYSDLNGTKAYLAGPPVMVETCIEALASLGINRTDCHADAFYSVHELAEREQT